MDELDSSSQLVYNGLEFYFAQVVGYRGPAQVKINGVQFDVYGYQKWRTDKDHPWSRLEIIPNGGWCSVIVGQWFEDVEVQQQGSAGQGGSTSTRELDSGPVAIPAGAGPTQILGPNNARTRGVAVQNVGLTSVALSTTAALAQGGLANAGLILSPDSAANVGNGGVATFAGWQGGLWAVNVAGGPGSVLVSAF